MVTPGSLTLMNLVISGMADPTNKKRETSDFEFKMISRQTPRDGRTDGDARQLDLDELGDLGHGRSHEHLHRQGVVPDLRLLHSSRARRGNLSEFEIQKIQT
jgi:hypothetical protein